MTLTTVLLVAGLSFIVAWGFYIVAVVVGTD